MKEVSDHLANVLDLVGPLPPLEVVLADAVGCVLAHDVLSDINLPDVDLAGEDGYAVRSHDVDGAHPGGPVQLRVLDEVRAGDTSSGVLVEMSAVRIASGAPIPTGADAVVPLEMTDRGDAIVNVAGSVDPGGNIRATAGDVHAGEIVLPAGIRIDARHIALLAAIGQNRVSVHPRPRVVIVSVGNELREPGRPLGPGQVFDANGHALATAVQAAGGTTFRVAAVADEHTELRDTLEDQLVRADLIITTGGLSYGANDTVKEVLSPLGTVRFDNVRIHPGRQFGVGTIGEDTPILCLPGHPVAALVGFEVFVRPALLAMAGHVELYRPAIKARLTQPWTSPAGRREFVPARIVGQPGGYQVTPTVAPGKQLVSGMARANALLVLTQDDVNMGVGVELNCLVLTDQ